MEILRLRGALTLDSIMVFVLDSYDSFTYNLVQYLGELGAEVEVYRTTTHRGAG